MTSRLATLRSQLAGLRRARGRVRAATAWSALAIAIVLALAALFVLDLVFELAVPQRIVAIALAAAAIAWSWWRFTRPHLGVRESEIDMALLVERQQEIDSDLVAALQFEQPEAKRWGSPQLETAVIDYVAAVGRGIDVFEGFSRDQMTRRGGFLAACLAIVLVAALVWPGHVRVFFNRLLLGSMHYPTATRIEQIAINERPVLRLADGEALPGQLAMRPAALKAAQGRPLTFHVQAAGDMPAKGTVYVQSTGASRARTSFDLRAATTERGVTIFRGELPLLLDHVTYKVVLGDAWTDPAEIEMVPLPIVDLRATPRPPKYARAIDQPGDASRRQLAVLEGSTVDLAIECTNRKRLKSAWLTLQAKDGAKRFDLVAQDKEGFVWGLNGERSPLENIREELRYEVQVVDSDGLSLEAPIRGTIRIRPDRPPSGLAEVIHKVVLPTAAPVVEYRATDDYGIGRLALVLEIERDRSRGDASESVGGSTIAGDGSETSFTPAAAIPTESHRIEILDDSRPATGEQLPLVGRQRLELSPLGLAKGDRVKLTLDVTDYRGYTEQGEFVGTAWQSDPLVLEVSDESGVLAAISEADQRSEERLTDIIKRQLGIGEAP
jgi:hypothetical protein